MNKSIVLILIASMMVIVLSTTAYAAVSGCWDGVADTTGRVGYIYNDTVNGTNLVDAGRVCWNTTEYNVVPTSAYYCSNNATAYVAFNCTAGQYYTGFDGTNASESVTNANCTTTGWVWYQKVTEPEWYYINGTANITGRHNQLADAYSKSYVSDAVSTTWNSCVNDYTVNGTAGYCDGLGAWVYANTTGVTAGKICAPNNGSSQYANSSDNCNTWMNCTLDSASADYVYLGYENDMSGDCNTDFAVDVGTDYTAPSGRTATTTGYAATCALKGYGYTYDMNDFSPIVSDALGTGGAEFVTWISIIVVLLVVLLLAGFVIKFKNGL